MNDGLQGSETAVGNGLQSEVAGRAGIHALILPIDSVPSHWKPRVQFVALIPLMPDETEQVLAEEPITPRIADGEIPFARLVAGGSTISEIASALRISHRSVERRIAQLRERFGAESKAELAIFLSRHLIGGEDAASPASEERPRKEGIPGN